MTRTIAIDPVTRIEGHAKVVLELDDTDALVSAGLVVNELRGFERLLVGMEADAAPLVTGRICGVCPSAHHLAAVKALDDACGATIPKAGQLLRELLYMGHFIHSHTLSLFVLQGPDLVMGLDAPPETRNVVGVVGAAPEVAKKALRLRTLGQKINETVGGRGVHPVTAVAGGISFKLDETNHKQLVQWADEALVLVAELAPFAKELLLKTLEKRPELKTWSQPTWYMGTVKDGRLNLYDGELRVMTDEGAIHAEFPTRDYASHLRERALDWSYMKPVFFRDGEELHAYRVNTLGRINVADSIDTPLAGKEHAAFRELLGRPCHLTVMHTYARVIELVYACENARRILDDPEIWKEARVPVKFRGGRGVGHVEAPRGALFHDYEIDENGIIRAANLIVATQQNYTAINESIRQAAVSYVIGRGDNALLNAVEFAIRCYDPCLSCATHAVGQMRIAVEVKRESEVLHRFGR